MELCKAPTEQLVGGHIHDSEGGSAILQPPAGQDGVASPQQAAVTHLHSGKLAVQGLKLIVQAFQGCRGMGSQQGCSTYQKNHSCGY